MKTIGKQRKTTIKIFDTEAQLTDLVLDNKKLQSDADLPPTYKKIKQHLKHHG